MSVWHTPHACNRTRTSPARGSARSTSVTFSGLANSSSTAARIFTVWLLSALRGSSRSGSSRGSRRSNDIEPPRSAGECLRNTAVYHSLLAGQPVRWHELTASSGHGTYGTNREGARVSSTRSDDLRQARGDSRLDVPDGQTAQPPASEIDLDKLLLTDREHWL